MPDFKALTYLTLGEEKVSPGDTISSDALEAAGQTKENIDQLLESGAISEDLEADVLEEHRDIERPAVTTDEDSEDQQILADEEGKGE